MGQRIAKRHADRGVTLYNHQSFAEALQELTEAYQKFQKDEDRFCVLGYLCLANLELGRYHQVLSCAKRQLMLSDNLEMKKFRNEAMFNMARAYERLGDFKTSNSMCMKSLQSETENVTALTGYAHLCIANNSHGLSETRKCLKHYDKASHVARLLCDLVLECRVYMGLGQLFVTLKDFVTALQQYVRASEIARQFDSNHPSVKYQRRIAVDMAVVYSRLGRLSEALEMCEESMKQALEYGDRMVQARCLLNFAEIHRERQNFQRAYPRYQSAYAIAQETGDRKCQLDVLSGMAVCAFCAQDFEQAVELYEKSLKLAQEIGAKLDILESRRRLHDIFMALDAPELAQLHGFHVQHLLRETQMFCGICMEVIGAKEEKIRPLPCYHIIHERCVVHLYRPNSTSTLPRKRRPCPTCRHRDSSNPTSDGDLSS